MKKTLGEASKDPPHITGGGSLQGRALGTEPLGAMVRVGLSVPGWSGATPGQFALLRAATSGLFLSRALSVSDEEGEELWFLVAPVGEGTRELSTLPVGAPVRVLGPLGNGFDLRELCGGRGRIVLVGGGVGIAPFPLLVSRLGGWFGRGRGGGHGPGSKGGPVRDGAGEHGVEVVVLLGFRDREQARGAEPVVRAVDILRAEGVACRLELVTEDGSEGRVGKVTDLLEGGLLPGDRVAVCGSWAMAEAVWGVCCAAKDVKAWFSLEANMACGVGSCHGCVIRVADGGYTRVCHDGPVFAGEVAFGG